MSDNPDSIMMSVPYDKWQSLNDRLKAAVELAAKYEQEKNDVLRSDPSEKVPTLIDTIRAALPVIQFAVGNLPPEAIRGWPFGQLLAFAKLFEKMPTLNAFEENLVLELKHFAAEASSVELKRQNRISDLRSIVTTESP